MGNGTKSVKILASQDGASLKRECAAVSRHIRSLHAMGFDILLVAGPASLPDQNSETRPNGDTSTGSEGASNTTAPPPSEDTRLPFGKPVKTRKEEATGS